MPRNIIKRSKILPLHVGVINSYKFNDLYNSAGQFIAKQVQYAPFMCLQKNEEKLSQRPTSKV